MAKVSGIGKANAEQELEQRARMAPGRIVGVASANVHYKVGFSLFPRAGPVTPSFTSVRTWNVRKEEIGKS